MAAHNLVDLTGRQFGCWAILDRAEDQRDGKTRWLCKCVGCGKTRAFGGRYLRTKSPPCDKCRLIAERASPPATKVCKGPCGQERPLEEFGRSYGCRYGKQSRCRECRSLEGRAHYIKSCPARLESIRKWRRKNPDYYAKISRERHLRNAYGISTQTYQELLAQQNGVCAVCKKPETKKSKNGKTLNLAVDHCHENGRIRGLLCCTCNSGIGLIGDTKERAAATVAYLEKAYA